MFRLFFTVIIDLSLADILLISKSYPENDLMK